MNDWREELAEKIAERINEMRLFQSTNTETARAALEVAEPVIRERCAKIAENTVLTSEDCCEETGVKIAAAIRERGDD